MVDAAPAPEDVLPQLSELLRGRVLVAHNAAFDVRVLRQAFARAALEWPAPPVLCTVALARRFAPLQRRRGLATLAAALGIEVDAVHRALPDALTCARVFCALFGRLCANAPTIGDAIALLARARPARGRRRSSRARRAPAPRRAPARAGRLHLPRRRRPPALRRQVGRPAHAGALALQHRRDVGGRRRARRPPGHGVRARRAAARGPADQGAAPAGQRARQDRARRLRLPALPAGHPVPDPRGRARARRGHAVCVGPVRGRAAAAELVEQLNSLFGLRHCGRTLPRREHPSAYGQMGRCLSPCLNDLDPNLYRERLDQALQLFVGRDGGTALLERVDAADPRGLGRAALRARGLAAAPPRPPRGAAGPPGRRAARDAHRRAARARAASRGGGALRRDLDRRRPRRGLGTRGATARRAGEASAWAAAGARGELPPRSDPPATSRGGPLARRSRGRPWGDLAPGRAGAGLAAGLASGRSRPAPRPRRTERARVAARSRARPAATRSRDLAALRARVQRGSRAAQARRLAARGRGGGGAAGRHVDRRQPACRRSSSGPGPGRRPTPPSCPGRVGTPLRLVSRSGAER